MAEPVAQNQYISIFGRTTGMNGDDFDPIEFEGNGIAVLNPSKCTITEALNGGYSLTLVHPTDSENVWKTIYPLNFIKAQGQLFRIQSVETSYDGSSSGNVSVYAEHVTYMMNDAWIFHGSNVHGNWMGGLLDKAKEYSRPNGYSDFGTNEKRFPNFTYSTDVEFPAEYKTDGGYYHPDIGEGKTRYQVMMEAIQKFGGELYRDNFYFSIYSRMENSLGGEGKLDAFDIRLGENMLGIKRKVDISNFCSYFNGYADDGSTYSFSYGDMTGLMNNIVREKHYSDANFGTIGHEVNTYFSYHMNPEFTYTLKLKDLRQNPDFKMLSGVRFKVGDIGRIVDERLGLNNNLRLEIMQTKTNGITGEVEEITLKSISAFEWDYGSVKLPEFPDVLEPQIDESKIAVIRLDENMQETSDIHYTDTVNEAKAFINANSGNMYHVHVGERSQAVPTLNGNMLGITNLYSIDIPDGVISLPSSMFKRCSGLTYVNLPDSIKEFESSDRADTFIGCSSLVSIQLPKNLRKIPCGSFKDCTALTSIDIPDNATEIEKEAFMNCTNLQSIIFGNGIIIIGINGASTHGAFENCTSLTEITIPDNVKTLGDNNQPGTFAGCSNLSTVVISGSVEKIGQSTFANCTSLINVEIQSGVKEILASAFFNCTSLKTVTLPESITAIGYRWGLLPYEATGGVFSGCENLEKIILPESLTEIRQMTFDRCKALKKITLPNSIQLIGENAFSYCESLQNINIPDGTTYIGDGAFFECVSLRSISLPDTLQELGGEYHAVISGIFYGCVSLTSISIPTNVHILRNTTFSGCTSLKRIDIHNRKCAIRNDPWGAPNFVSTAYADQLAAEGKLIPEGKYVAYWAGSGEDEEKLAEMALLKVIDSNGVVVSYNLSKTFSGIRSTLTENSDKTFVVELGDAFNMEAWEQSNVVPSDCFAGLTNVKSIYIPQRFRTIEENAFSDCTALAFVHIDKPKGEISGEPWGAPSGTVIYYSASLVTNTGDKLTIAKDTTPFAVRTTGNNAEFDTGLSGILLTNTEPEEPVENTLYLLNKSNVFKLELDGKELKL